jgi:hypothetical protein
MYNLQKEKRLSLVPIFKSKHMLTVFYGFFGERKTQKRNYSRPVFTIQKGRTSTRKKNSIDLIFMFDIFRARERGKIEN